MNGSRRPPPETDRVPQTDPRAAVLARALDRVLTGDASAAADELATSDDPWAVALAGFTAFLARRFDVAAELAVRARAAVAATPDDREATLLAAAAHGLAVAGGGAAVGGLRGWVDGDDPLGDALAARLTDGASTASGDAAAVPGGVDVARFSRYALAEAALACARLDLAAAFVEAGDAADASEAPAHGFLTRGGTAHPFHVVMSVMRVRLLAFRGRISDAQEVLSGLEAPAEPPLVSVLIASADSLVRGNAAERAEARALADRVEFAHPDPDDYLSSGCYLLAAFGLVAVGEVRRAARLALRAGSDEDFSGYAVVDRGLALELLMAAAVLEGDLDSAEAWWVRVEPLLASPISASTAQRVRSRLELLRGDAAAAVVWADRAVAIAQADGRHVEAAEGGIVAARARIAASQAGEASIRLEALVDLAEPTGFHAARRAAARELRAAGRRLRPSAGSDWEGLSVRERDIALMLAEGQSNREIAHDLHLSEHTVRAHVSRVLAAFGAPSRFGVAARVAELFPAAPSDAPAALTPRQDAVAERIARGAGNAEIGAELDLSVKTIEKHIGEILRRWHVTSRVGIARVWRARSATSASLTRSTGADAENPAPRRSGDRAL